MAQTHDCLLPKLAPACIDMYMPYDDFSHVNDWVFDLDHTLYPASNNLFLQLEKRMETFLMRELSLDLATAKKLRATYWKEHGTTLAGMMHHHGTEPVAYLNEVQDIDFSVLAPNPALAISIAALPGRKIVYTNGSSDYAAKATKALGLFQSFDALYGIDHAGYISKPNKVAFERVFDTVDLTHNSAAMFEDDQRNLVVPHQMGLKTVLVGSTNDAPHIHHNTNNLTAFLKKLTSSNSH